jgi:ABC-2 type transport system permease protein
MNGIYVIARKEIRLFLHNPQLLVSAVIFSLVFGLISGPAVIMTTSGVSEGQVYTLLVSLSLMTGLLIGYLLSGQTFLREKQEGTIETLLAGPLPLRQIWLGKVLGVLVPAYILTVFSSVLMIGIASAMSGQTSLPPGPIIVHMVIVVPAFIASGVGLLGFVQLLLGMRENQIINIVVIFGLIFLISFSRELMGPGFEITWSAEGLFLAFAVVLILITKALTRVLDKEKIVRTIP